MEKGNLRKSLFQQSLPPRVSLPLDQRVYPKRNRNAKGLSRLAVGTLVSLFVGASVTSEETLKVYESLSETIQTKRFRAGKDDEPLTVQAELAVPGRGKMGETLESQVLQDTPPSESEH